MSSYLPLLSLKKDYLIMLHEYNEKVVDFENVTYSHLRKYIICAMIYYKHNSAFGGLILFILFIYTVDRYFTFTSVHPLEDHTIYIPISHTRTRVNLDSSQLIYQNVFEVW